MSSTAGWLWQDPRAVEAIRWLDDVAHANDSQRTGEGTAYLALLLAAHFATVATFVPTDVDARIRHHVWTAMSSGTELAAATELIDVVSSWDVNAVSARWIDGGSRGRVSGHDGEWLAVRAGALGRALALGEAEIADRLASQIEGEIEREEAIFLGALESRATAQHTLAIATILAHNLGDLSRVVAEWPRTADADRTRSLRERWTRLGHPDAPSRRDAFVLAGNLNRSLMAHENHRFLPLRKPRGLRRSRALLLPIGPWFDGWGETVARSNDLDPSDRADVLAALLEIHSRDPNQEGCLRAIAGLHRATRGGIEVFVPDLPARMRKDALRGRVRDALDISGDHFTARMDRRYALARSK